MSGALNCIWFFQEKLKKKKKKKFRFSQTTQILLAQNKHIFKFYLDL